MAIKINTIEQYEKMLEERDKVFLMKHSKTCPISLNAFDQFNNFLYERDIDGYYLVVQDSRELSNDIAERTGIRHESPQVIYYVDGEPVWNASHNQITIATLSGAEE